MSREQTSSNNRVFYTIFDQKFRTRVPEGTEGAIVRKLEKGPNAGKLVSEREIDALYGIIENIALEDSDYGKQIKITMDANGDGKHPVIGVAVESKNGRDLMKILPNVDFSKEVRIFPYRFTPEDKEISGISIAHIDEDGKFNDKAQNFFVDPKTKKPINGMPSIDWDTTTEAEQKIFKITRDEFLLSYLKDNVLPKFNEQTPSEIQYPENSFDDSDMPF